MYWCCSSDGPCVTWNQIKTSFLVLPTTIERFVCGLSPNRFIWSWLLHLLCHWFRHRVSIVMFFINILVFLSHLKIKSAVWFYFETSIAVHPAFSSFSLIPHVYPCVYPIYDPWLGINWAACPGPTRSRNGIGQPSLPVRHLENDHCRFSDVSSSVNNPLNACSCVRELRLLTECHVWGLTDKRAPGWSCSEEHCSLASKPAKAKQW